MNRPSVSIVTGAVGGMGEQCARRFAARGNSLVLTDVDQDRLDEVVATLSRGGARVEAITRDLTDPSASTEIAGAVARLGRFSSLAHTAGLSPSMPT